MISRLTVRTFKSLESVEVDLGQINVFVGANGSGKSNLLESIGVLSAAANGRVDDESLLRRGVRPGVPNLYKSAFPGRRLEPHIFFGAQSDNSVYEVSLFNPLKDPEPAWRYNTERWDLGDERIVRRGPRMKDRPNAEAGLAALKAVERAPGDKALELLDLLRQYSIYTPETPILRGIAPEHQPRDPVGLSGGNLATAIHRLQIAGKRNSHIRKGLINIQELIDWAKSFGAAPATSMPLSPSASASRTVVRFKDRYMAEGRNFLSGYDASEGALYVLFLAVLALDERVPRLIAVDNADHGLNPRLARELIKVFCGWILKGPVARQVLITTHNPLVLDGLPLQDHRVRLFTVSRTITGRTDVKQVVLNEKIMNYASNGWTLSRLWVMGHLGGVPNI